MELENNGGQTINITDQDIQLPNSKKSKRSKKPRKPLTKKQKIIYGIAIGVSVLLIATIIVVFILANKQAEIARSEHPDWPDPIYSILTGEEITDAKLNSSPTYCVQTPNGTDGGRPQVGLNQAGVVFEAIAEAGITRFAAVYQNPTSSMIGPIRSLRIYYLNWDTPFDCTIVHAGGADDAIAALRAGGYRDHTENYTYMWRDSDRTRRWNNLFTSSEYLFKFNADQGILTSNPTGFTRMTPYEAATRASDNIAAANPTPTTDDQGNDTTPAAIPLVTDIAINFGNVPTYNTVYKYNPDTNSYARSYANGDAHMVYTCPEGLIEPTLANCGEPVQISPKVVIAMVVQESKAADNYHENITTFGTGKAYIFQNGEAIVGTWSKPDAATQVEFKDADGNVIPLGTGQTWIAAVPNYGSVKY